MRAPRVALVHDWLASYGGAEQVLLELHRMFPDAPVFTSVYEPARLPAAFHALDVRTSFLQRLPFARRRYQAYLPLMPLAFESFDLRGYDLILSDAHACAKGVIAPQGATHVCYCYTPIRYAWTHQEEYLRRAPLAALVSPVARPFLARIRTWDFVAAQGVDHFVADCQNVRDRIRKYYRRDAGLVYPPAHVERFNPTHAAPASDAPFLLVTRLVAYKRAEVAVHAFNQLGLPLLIVGRGPESSRLRGMAGPNVKLLGAVPDDQLESLYRDCRALVFPSDEDFGLVPLEAMASGRPVLALDAGGARETVVPGLTGELYPDGGPGDAGVAALVEAMRDFAPEKYSPLACRARAEEFAPARFRSGLLAELAAAGLPELSLGSQ